EPVEVVLEQGLAEAVDGPQRRPQVVGDGVAEGLKLPVHGDELGVAAGEVLVQQADAVLRPLPLGDVADDAGDEEPVVVPDGGQADLDRYLAAVLAAADEVQAG